jgi:cupin fold WbuC family metalloprotein
MKVSVFYNEDIAAEVGEAWYEKLKRHAFEADLKRARLCLHHSAEDALHEMVIVFHRDTLVSPHRHVAKSESFHLIFGELDVVLFDEAGRPTRVIRMGERGTGRSQVYRLSGPVWHSVIVHSEYAAIHEVTNGPFRPEAGDFAPWAPTEPAALRAFLARSLDEALTAQGPGAPARV